MKKNMLFTKVRPRLLCGLLIVVMIASLFATAFANVESESETETEATTIEEKQSTAQEATQSTEKETQASESNANKPEKKVKKESIKTQEDDADDEWTLWESGQRQIEFKLNYIDAVATVSRPGNPEYFTGYMTNANQFGVSIMMNNKRHTYTFADGSAESSGVFFAIGGNGSSSPYMLRPNTPQTVNGSGQVHYNPNEVRSDYKYYYADKKVKETSEIKLPTGETLEFTHQVEFKNGGVFHRTFIKNTGDEDINDFRILNKVDTYLVNDSVPVYYGESQHTYYIKQSPNADLKLRVSGLKGITGSLATKHERIWTDGFINKYRTYNATLMERAGTLGSVAFSGQWPNDDSEIVFDQRPYTLHAGETTEASFAVNFLSGKTVTVHYVDEDGKEIAESEFLQGDLDQAYSAVRKEVAGYKLNEDKIPANETGTFKQTEQEVIYVYEKAKYTVAYHANGGAGTVPESDSTYLSGQEVTVLDGDELNKADHKFIGWNTDADGSGTLYYPGDVLTMPSSNVDLYAQWEELESTDKPTVMDPTNKTKPTTKAPGKETSKPISPGNTQTGDDSNMTIWIIVIIAAALVAAIAAIPTIRKRMKK